MRMIITYTETVDGQRRVYVGGKSSLECYITPIDDHTWTLGFAQGFSSQPFDADTKDQWAKYILLQLCERLDVRPDDLLSVPFDVIVAQCDASPLENKRVPMPRKRSYHTAYMQTTPNLKRPSTDFTSSEYSYHRARHK